MVGVWVHTDRVVELDVYNSALDGKLARLAAHVPASRSCGATRRVTERRLLASQLAGVALALGARLNAGLPPARSRRTGAALQLRHSALDRTPARISARRRRARPSARLAAFASQLARAALALCGSRRST
jgi:hypothetical protein